MLEFLRLGLGAVTSAASPPMKVTSLSRRSALSTSTARRSSGAGNLREGMMSPQCVRGLKDPQELASWVSKEPIGIESAAQGSAYPKILIRGLP